MPYRFGPFRYDPVSRCLFRGDREVALRPKTRELLLHFLKNPHRLLSHDELTDLVWPDTAITDDALRLQVHDLRKALGEDGDRLIRTVPREGYRWEADVLTGSTGEGDLVCRLVFDRREIELAEGENIIGRDRGVAVWIEDSAVSRQHARIVVTGGRAAIEDLGSKNGTVVGGERIDGEVSLGDGDTIVIGPATITFRALLRGKTTQTQEETR
jgi:DNA-binding winged helix-turn-helix (wHTH) protein